MLIADKLHLIWNDNGFLSISWLVAMDAMEHQTDQFDKQPAKYSFWAKYSKDKIYILSKV